MDSSLRKKFRLTFFGVALGMLAGACAQVNAGAMPSVTPISSVPIGPAAGGGIETQVTYEIGATAAANDAGVAVAANEASFVTRAVTIGGGTVATMARGILGRAFWPVAALSTAYAAYKWYQDAHGTLTQPGGSSPAPQCTPGGGVFTTGGYFESGQHCSVVAAQASWNAGAAASHWPTHGDLCVPPQNGRCYFDYTVDYGSQGVYTYQDSVQWNMTTDNTGIVDPAIVTDPRPVSDSDLDNVVQHAPDSWPQMFNDPDTGKPVITPEIGDDEDKLKHQIAPKYGVDPTTLPTTDPTPTNPNYPTGQADPNADPTGNTLPDYCNWAVSACKYYKFVEDNWPTDGKKKETDSPDCVTPPSCSGDDVMCGVVRNTWAEKCATTDVPTGTPDGGAHKIADLSNPDVDAGDTTHIDQSGFGWNTACPFMDVPITIGSSTANIPMTPICEFGPWLRAFILMMAGLKAAMIIAGLRDVAK